MWGCPKIVKREIKKRHESGRCKNSNAQIVVVKMYINYLCITLWPIIRLNTIFKLKLMCEDSHLRLTIMRFIVVALFIIEFSQIWPNFISFLGCVSIFISKKVTFACQNFPVNRDQKSMLSTCFPIFSLKKWNYWRAVIGMHLRFTLFIELYPNL